MSEVGKKKKSSSSKAKSFSLPSGESVPQVLPVLATSEITPFPSVVMSLFVSNSVGIHAVEEAVAQEDYLVLATHAGISDDSPKFEALSEIGVLGRVLRTMGLPDGGIKVLVQGVLRVKIQEPQTPSSARALHAFVEPIHAPKSITLSAEDESLVNRIHENLRILVDNDYFPEEILVVTDAIDGPGELADVVAAHHQLDVERGNVFLQETNPLQSLRLVDELLTQTLNQYFVNERIRTQAQERMSEEQREYLLRSQLKVIQRELGDEMDEAESLEDLRSNLAAAKLPALVQKEADRQLSRLDRMPPESSEYSLLRTYLEWLGDLPWSKKSRERLDLRRAASILSAEHFGLDKVKDRILEYLSVRKLRRDPEGPILCFVGPPGVGKTSLGRSIAEATNREFVRISIGGVRDEAEIRGHRRTYVGALPGRIIQGIKQAGTKNPVFVLDELDKVGADFRGDPASALLEVLDPHQNTEFVDHYLNVPFDLSQVMFIATANTEDTIPSALLDRLEVINISGYTVQEKVRIAEKYLVPRQLEKNGLDKYPVSFDRSSILTVIEEYTREAGVRNLEREIGNLCRKIARGYAEGKRARKRVSVEFVAQALGPSRYDPETTENDDAVGLVKGLAWTTVGGELLPIEASVAPGKGALSLTGRLGEIMQESGRAALFYIRANAERLGVDPKFSETSDIHVHLPDGATPKDGPSAGISLVTAIVSVLSNKPVAKDVAMTGEITLRGNVRRIGGLKEKALAALRYGVKRVIIPFENMKDLEEIPKDQRSKLKFIPVKHVSEVLEIALRDKVPSQKGKPLSKKPSVKADAKARGSKTKERAKRV